MNPGLTKTFVAGGAINPRRFIKFGGDDDTVVQAAAATDSIIGVADIGQAVASGERVDVVLNGLPEVEAGGVITRGGLVTSDSDGKAVAAAPATGVNNRTAGFAYQTSVDTQHIPVLLAPASMQGA